MYILRRCAVSHWLQVVVAAGECRASSSGVGMGCASGATAGARRQVAARSGKRCRVSSEGGAAVVTVRSM